MLLSVFQIDEEIYQELVQCLFIDGFKDIVQALSSLVELL